MLSHQLNRGLWEWFLLPLPDILLFPKYTDGRRSIYGWKQDSPGLPGISHLHSISLLHECLWDSVTGTRCSWWPERTLFPPAHMHICICTLMCCSKLHHLQCAFTQRLIPTGGSGPLLLSLIFWGGASFLPFQYVIQNYPFLICTQNLVWKDTVSLTLKKQMYKRSCSPNIVNWFDLLKVLNYIQWIVPSIFWLSVIFSKRN